MIHQASLPSLYFLPSTYYSRPPIMLQAYFTQFKQYITSRPIDPTPAVIPPTLTPEIYLMIAQHIKRPFPVHDAHLPSIEKRINAEQDTLLKLMQTSKVSRTSILESLI